MAKEPIELDRIDRELLNVMQEAFPLVPRPYAELGAMVGLSQDDVIERVKRLKVGGIIRQTSAIFDSRRIGYQSTLVAVKVAPERIDEAARIINKHPGVSHNYARNSEFNIWYTLTIPPWEGLEETVERLGREAGAERSILLPTVRLFKINVKLDMTGEKDMTRPGEAKVDDEEALARAHPSEIPSDRDIEMIRVLQKDLPIIPRPFQAEAEALGITEDELCAAGRDLEERGLMRRFASILRHRQAGFSANGMGVWNVPPEKRAELGPLMAAFPGVSHCYERPTYDDWPYSVYTMVHARTVEECDAVLKAISDRTGITDYQALYSTKEYKKIRVKYFVGTERPLHVERAGD